MNNAPFRVGQRVVCVDDSHEKRYSWCGVIKGCEYVIKRVKPGLCKCHKWIVDIGFNSDTTVMRCLRCGVYVDMPDTTHWLASSRFAPIPPRSIEIPESLKEQAEEMKDLAETIAPMKKELV